MKIDALFQVPLGEFTQARNALAVTLKSAGRPDDAAHVKTLAKPTLPAWAANQLYWRHRKTFDRLIAAGQRLRTAQASQLHGKGGDMREPIEARAGALSELSQLASALLAEAGHPVTPDVMRRITTTLEALATYGHDPSSPPAGRLTDDVAAPGFEALAALVPRKGGRRRGTEPTRVIPFRRRPERKAGKALNPAERKRRDDAERPQRIAASAAVVRAAEHALTAARKAAAKAETVLKEAAARAKHAEREKNALAARVEKLAAEADQRRQEARRIAGQAEDAAQALADAERALDEARRAQQSLS